MSTREVYIYFDDLTPAKQQEILDAVGAEDAFDLNTDTPLAIVVFEEEEEADA